MDEYFTGICTCCGKESDLLAANYFWGPGMSVDVVKYCPECAKRFKNTNKCTNNYYKLSRNRGNCENKSD